MKRLLSVFVLLLLAAVPALATSVGTDVGVDIITEDFAPLIWMCDDRVVRDDNVQWGRTSEGGEMLSERNNNYAFEGESIEYEVLVMDKNGIQKIEDVFMTLGDTQGEGNDIEVNCVEDAGWSNRVDSECNARIGEEDLTGEYIDPLTQRYYRCTFTVETPDSMAGEFWLTTEVTDLDGLSGTVAENEYWFFNPVIALTVAGDLVFEDVRPGTDAYSETLLVENDAEDGSGVLLDMFISGTDFYDSSSSGAVCSDGTNKLALSTFRYYGVNGAYSTVDDVDDDNGVYDPATDRDIDSEGYVNIQYGDSFSRTMYNEAEIIQANPINGGTLGYAANLLAPGAEMALTFKLSLPEPCNGDFDTGSIFFWGEAV